MSRADLRPDSAELADAARDWISAYVHVPFCARVCPYCDFAVVAGRDDLADRYLAALETEIDAARPWEPLDAVFVGGGTPSRFGRARLTRIIEVLAGKFGLATKAEVTLEANPEDWTGHLADELVSGGFTRVSFGAQSLDPLVLANLGRRHDPADVVQAVLAARAAGFTSISVDLIFGTPGETLTGWTDTVRSAIELSPDHVSCYALTVERGTPLGRSVAAGAEAPDPDIQADQYEAAARLLGEAGYVRYEVSNWARPGHVCRYNLAVWAQGEYEAFGNGANGYRLGERYANIRRLDAYLDLVERTGGARSGTETIAGWDAELDRLFVGLRRAAGVSDGPGTRRLLGSEDGRRLLRSGVISQVADRLVVANPLLTDAVERAVLGLDDPSAIERDGARH